MSASHRLPRPSRWPGLVAVVVAHVAVGYAVLTWREREVPAPPPVRVQATLIAEAPPLPVVVPKPTPAPVPPTPRPAPVLRATPVPSRVPQVAPAPAPSFAPVEAPLATPPTPPALAPAPPPATVPAPAAATVNVVCPNYQKAMGDSAFPREASRLGLDQGDVLVEFTVTASGEVKNVRTVRASHPAFGRAAVRLVSEYRCVGQGREVTVQVPIGYRLAS
jgi:protein TonB